MTERNPAALSGKPPPFKPRRKRRTPAKGGYSVITVKRAKPAHTVKPPANLVAQVARHIVGDTSGFRTDWPKPLLATAASHMRAAHYPGLENRGAAWVKRTINRINHFAKKLD